MTEGILRGFVTDNHGENNLAWITIPIVPGIGCNLFSVKSATNKGVVSIFDLATPGWSYPASLSHFVQKMMTSTL